MSRSVLGLLLFCLVVPVGQRASDSARQRIPVFVRSEATVSGFTDPSKDRRDSIKDLQKRIRDSREVRLAESDADALIILEVLGRETKREVNFFGAQNKSSVAVRLIAGEYTTEFSGESGSKGVFKGYGDAAGKIVKQLEEWVRSNRDQLLTKSRAQ